MPLNRRLLAFRISANIMPIALLLGLSLSLSAQIHTLHGVVKDGKTGKTLPFATLYDLDNQIGTIADIDGRFTLKTNSSIRRVRCSYVGYLTDTINTAALNQNNLVIELTLQSLELNTFQLYPGENPAHRLIKNAVANRKENNPNNYKTYTYTSYNKLLATFEYTKAEMDSLKNIEGQGLYNFLERSHLFLSLIHISEPTRPY